MEGMWTLLQRHRVGSRTESHRDQLEQLVEERAAELVVAHEALQHSHAELQAIYNGMADGLLIADLETRRFVRANAAICRMLDCSEKEVLSMAVMGVPLVADSPAVWDEFRKLAEGQSWRSENVPIRLKDGTVLHADVTTNHIVYKGRPCLAGFFHDTTQRKKAEEALLRERRISQVFVGVQRSRTSIDKLRDPRRPGPAVGRRHDAVQCVRLSQRPSSQTGGRGLEPGLEDTPRKSSRDATADLTASSPCCSRSGAW